MKNAAMQNRLGDEMLAFVQSRRSLQLASLCENGLPYASYAPYAIGDDCLYILISDIAIHARNLLQNPNASILIIEDEEHAEELFARVRINYRVRAEAIALEDTQWETGVALLEARHGERPRKLSELADFTLFKLHPLGGRYVKGFGRAYDIAGETLAGEVINHQRDGHKPRIQAVG
jgi:hypothetical protein